MSKYNEYVVDKVARAIYDIEFGDGRWDRDTVYEETPDDWHSEPYVNFRNFARKQARAALAAIDSLYESEAEQPVEYAGIEGGL